jgi:hypothetical protein
MKVPGNQKRVRELASRRRRPKFELGQLVREPHGSVGAIDKIFADFESVLDDLCFPHDWYELQERRPRTPKSGVWYGVILEDGAVLVGEDDLAEVPS